MRNRTLALLLGATLVFGGAACSDDDDSDAETELENVGSNGGDAGDAGDSDSGDPGDSGDSGDGASGDVEAFCDAVDAYVEEAQEIMADPTGSDVADIQAESQELTEQASALLAEVASLTDEDVERLNACAASIAEGLMPGN